jgi:hypothetical protein
MKSEKMVFLSTLWAVALILSSCEKKDELVTSKIDLVKDGIYLHKNGFLAFSDNDLFERTVTMLSTSDFSQVKKWEDSFNFISMRTLFQQGLEIEEKLTGQLKNSGSADKKYSEFVSKNRNVFKSLDDGVLTANLYRIDLVSLVNKDGIVKVGNVIFQYSYDYLKVIEDGDASKISLLNNITETNRSLKIFVSKVSRVPKNTANGRTSFYQRNSFTTIDRENEYCRWDARLVAELTLATVNVPVYTQVERLCYDNDFNDKPYTCYETILVRTDTRNYFEAFCYNEVETGICSWGGYGADSRYQLLISGTYKETGVSKSLYRISASPTSQLRHLIYNSINTPNVDIVDAAITFNDVNNPKGKTVFIGFN